MRAPPPSKPLVRELTHQGFESPHLDRLRRSVNVDPSHRELEREILQEMEAALGRAEDRVNLALLELEVPERELGRLEAEGSAEACEGGVAAYNPGREVALRRGPGAEKGTAVSVRFVGERLRPLSRTADTSCLAAGAPGLPLRFLWRDVAIDVARVRRTWRETGACVHGSGERYVRRHWFEVIAATGEVFTLYFERRARRGERKRGRWWLYGIACEGEGVVVARGCRPNPGER